MRTPAQRVKDLEFNLRVAMDVLQSVYAIADRLEDRTPEEVDDLRRAGKLLAGTEGGPYRHQAATVAELQQAIKVAAAARGCYLTRCQMDFGNNRNILYAIKPDGPTALLTTREGTGRKCEAFRLLSKLLAEIS